MAKSTVSSAAAVAAGLCLVAWALPTVAFEPTDAVSVEVSVFSGPTGILDAVSPEVSVLAGPVYTPDALSAELTVYSGSDAFDQWSDALTSELTVRNVPLGQEKQQQDGVEVATAGGVTAKFADGIYLETVDRSSGIKVTGLDAEVADRLAVFGTVQTDPIGERYLSATTISDYGQLEIMALETGVRALWFEDFFYNDLTKAGQIGVDGGAGLATAGLLVRARGRVVSAQPDSCVLDDGSGKTVRCVLPPGAVVQAGRLAAMTGVVSLELDAGVLKPLVRMRYPSDVFVLD